MAGSSSPLVHSVAEALLGSGPHQRGPAASRQDLEVHRTDSSGTRPACQRNLLLLPL